MYSPDAIKVCTVESDFGHVHTGETCAYEI